MSATQTHEPPEGWAWGIGERGDTYYDYWCYHEDWEAHQYWDRGGEHHVEFLEIIGFSEIGDPMYDYPSHTDSFPTEEEATEYLLETAGELIEDG